MDLKTFLLKSYIRLGVSRLLIITTLLMFVIYVLEERILSRYHDNVDDTKLPFMVDNRAVVRAKRKPQVTPVIILGYMRSGSSLTGDILQQNSDAFYVFEPLHDLQKQYYDEMEEMFPELQIRQRKPTYEFKDNAIQLFRAWFSCDIKYITADKTRYHFNFFKYGNKTRKLVQCLEKTSNQTNLSSRLCTRILRKECLKSKVRIIKTIRTRLTWLLDILEEFPTLKIIHLVRDPRAVVNSLIRVGECKKQNGGMSGCSHYFCSDLEDDLSTFKTLKILYQDRILRISYENLANNPIPMAKRMYKFIDLELDSVAEGYIGNITMAGNNSTGAMSTIRANSSIHIDAWRTNLSTENLFIVQTICKSVMGQLGYHHYIRP